ncbi:MAG: zinc-binding dehydrogenase [Clostridiales bacterium]|jgi:L-iditol 2-dehydrogenase|nr:zinc-binding dehydrogenase [Clostridiales bacterium]
MKALVIEKDFSFGLKEVPIPEIGEYQALIKIQASAICGTDLKILHGKFSGFTDYPTILGHEAVGVVVERGAKVRNFEIGDRVLHPIIYEKIGGYYSTFGAMAEYAVVEDHEALAADGIPIDEKRHHDHSRIQYKIPSHFEPVPSTMLITFREVYSTFKRANIQRGQSLVLYGLGPVGQVMVAVCKQAGVKTVAVVRRAEKAKLAEALGADIVINSSVSDTAEAVRRHFPGGVDAVWDAAGFPGAINEGLKMIRPFGKIVMYGVMEDTHCLLDWKDRPLSFDLIFTQLPDKDAEIAAMDEIVSMVADGRLNGMDYISDVIPFENAEEGIKMFLERRNKKKIVFKLK